MIDRHDAHIGRTVLDGGGHASEGVVRQDLYLAAEIFIGRDLVETTLVSLYGYFQHKKLR